MKFSDWLDISETMELAGDLKTSLFLRLVAASYMLAPTHDPSADAAFRELASKIQRQKEFLSSRFDLVPTNDDPYRSSRELARHIDAQRAAGVRRPEVKVLAEPPAGGHPAYSNDQNVTQRGVHDVIAHYFGRHPFSARGELGAYNRHLKTLCDRDGAAAGRCLAAKAMFTEVVAQTACYYVYGDYVPQKAVILHDFDHYRIGRLAPMSGLNAFFEVVGKKLKAREDFDQARFSARFPELAAELGRQGRIPLS